MKKYNCLRDMFEDHVPINYRRNGRVAADLVCEPMGLKPRMVQLMWAKEEITPKNFRLLNRICGGKIRVEDAWDFIW